MTNTIREAIGVLTRVGWTKNAFTDHAGRHCLQGALYDAHQIGPVGEHPVWRPVTAELGADVRLVNEVIQDQFPERAGGIGASRFNDHPDTTLEDVILVMEKAAVRKDERG
jgi:hypothetical protein